MHSKVITRVARIVSLSVLAAALAPQLGCAFGREFRAIAGPSVHTGVKQIVNGFVDGLFAAATPDPVNDTDASASTP